MSSSDLRRAIRRQQTTRSHKGARYPAELRRQVVEYVKAQRSEGRPIRAIAAALGLPVNTLTRWSTKATPGRVRRVEVVGPSPASSVVLISPRGHRVEGLDLPSLALLLERLS